MSTIAEFADSVKIVLQRIENTTVIAGSCIVVLLFAVFIITAITLSKIAATRFGGAAQMYSQQRLEIRDEEEEEELKPSYF